MLFTLNMLWTKWWINLQMLRNLPSALLLIKFSVYWEINFTSTCICHKDTCDELTKWFTQSDIIAFSLHFKPEWMVFFLRLRVDIADGTVSVSSYIWNGDIKRWPMHRNFSGKHYKVNFSRIFLPRTLHLQWKEVCKTVENHCRSYQFHHSLYGRSI